MKSEACAFAPQSRHWVKRVIQATPKRGASALPVRLRPTGDCTPPNSAVDQWRAEAAEPFHNHVCSRLACRCLQSSCIMVLDMLSI